MRTLATACVLALSVAAAPQGIVCDTETEPNNSPPQSQAYKGPACGSVTPLDNQDWYEIPLDGGGAFKFGEIPVNFEVHAPGATIGVQVWQLLYDLNGQPVSATLLYAGQGTGGLRAHEIAAVYHPIIAPSFHVRIMMGPGFQQNRYDLVAWSG